MGTPNVADEPLSTFSTPPSDACSIGRPRGQLVQTRMGTPTEHGYFDSNTLVGRSGGAPGAAGLSQEVSIVGRIRVGVTLI